jgi:hypothetical protein
MTGATLKLTFSSIALPALDARYVFSAVLPAISKDEVTPLICGALVQVEDGRLKVIATDRYRIHRAYAGADLPDTEPFVVPRRLVQWIATHANHFGRSIFEPTVQLDVTRGDLPEQKASGSAIPCPSGTVTVTVREQGDKGDILAFTTPLSPGNYLPVERLLTVAEGKDADGNSGRVNPFMLRGTSALARDRNETATLRMVKEDNPNRSGQVLITYRDGSALIQQRGEEPA